MKKIILIFLLFIQIPLFAQNETGFFKEKYLITDPIEKLSVRMAYYGIYTFHPGLKVGVEYPIKRKVKEISKFPILSKIGLYKSSRIKTIHKDWISSANFAMYKHKDNNTGIMLNAELARRRTGFMGLYREFNLGFGFLKTFQPATYEITSSGDIDKKILPGHLYGVFNLGVALGIDYSINGNNKLAMYLKPTYFLMFPNNSLFALNSALEVGITYKFLSNPFNK